MASRGKSRFAVHLPLQPFFFTEIIRRREKSRERCGGRGANPNLRRRKDPARKTPDYSPGVKPIQEAKPGYEYFYLYGAVEPETGQQFPAKHDRLNSDCFQVFLDQVAKAFPRSQNILVLDNGTLP